MIQGLLAAAAVILRLAFLFGVYYLIKGLLLLSGRRLPSRERADMSREDWEKWAAGEGRVCLYWAGVLFLASICVFLVKTLSYILMLTFAALLVIGYVKRVKNNIKYRK